MNGLDMGKNGLDGRSFMDSFFVLGGLFGFFSTMLCMFWFSQNSFSPLKKR